MLILPSKNIINNENNNYKFYFLVKNIKYCYFKSFIQSFILQKYKFWRCLFLYDDDEIKQNIKFYLDYKQIADKFFFIKNDTFNVENIDSEFLENYDSNKVIMCLINMNNILANENILSELNSYYNNFKINMMISSTSNNTQNINSIIRSGAVNKNIIHESNIGSLFFTFRYNLLKVVINKYKTQTTTWFNNIIDNYIIWVSLYLSKGFYYLNNNVYLITNKYRDLINNIEFKSNYKNHHFTFIIPSFNNEKNIHKNLYSVINQTYDNWTAIYINDNSTDSTEDFFNQITNETNTTNKFTYIKNEERMGQMYNKYIAYKYVNDFDIVCILDGDDWLANVNVLEELNYYYGTTDYKIICSNFVYYNDEKYTIKKYYDYPDLDKKSNNLRYTSNWYFSHLKTGYGYLFKYIPDSYLKINGDWLDRCTDWGETFSACELSKGNIKLLEDYFYIYNKENSLQYTNSYYNDNTNRRKYIENYIRQLPKCKFDLPYINIINMEKDIHKKINMIKQLNFMEATNYKFYAAVDGTQDSNINELMILYNNLTSFNILDKYKGIFNIKKRHISHSSLGLLASVFNIFKDFIDSDNQHILLIEDDVYCRKDINDNIFINSESLKNKDIVYLGCQNNNIKLYEEYVNGTQIFIDIKKIKPLIYGTYSVIISKKLAEYILNIGLENVVKMNLSFDLLLNYIRFTQTDISAYLYFKQLFIPEVRKDGINGIRTNEFYENRNIDLNNYYL